MPAMHDIELRPGTSETPAIRERMIGRQWPRSQQKRGAQLPAALPKGLDMADLRAARSRRQLSKVSAGKAPGWVGQSGAVRAEPSGGQSPRLDNAFPPFLLPIAFGAAVSKLDSNPPREDNWPARVASCP